MISVKQLAGPLPIHIPVLSITSTTPGSPSIGDRHLVGTSPTGAFVGHENHLAEYEGSGWTFVAPIPNSLVLVGSVRYRFTGSAWVTDSGGSSPYFDDDDGNPTIPPAATGGKAIAIGDGALAEAPNSFAVGNNSRTFPTSNNSIVMGVGARAGIESGPYLNGASDSIVLGTGARAGRDYSGYQYDIFSCIAIGRNAEAAHFFAIAIGDAAQSQNQGVAVGRGALAASSGVALGAGSLSLGGVSIGSAQQTSGGEGVVIGNGVLSQASSTVAIGQTAAVRNMTSAYSLALGRSATVGSPSWGARSSVAIGHNARVLDPINLLQSGIAIGRSANVAGSYGVAIGYEAAAGASGTIRGVGIGFRSHAKNQNAISIGINNINGGASGVSCIAMGQGSVAGSGANAVAIGYAAAATPPDAIALGRQSNSAGTYSIAIGRFASAFNNSVVIGPNANGSSSTGAVVVGSNISASGSVQPIAIGFGAQIGIGSNAIAIGVGAISSGSAMAIGTNANSSGSSIVIGTSAAVAGAGSFRNTIMGRSARAGHIDGSATDTIALGPYSRAYNTTTAIAGAIAIGHQAHASAEGAIALGQNSTARVPNTIHTQASSILRKDEPAALQSTNEAFRWMAGNETIVMTKEVDLKALGTITLAVPVGARFYLTEVGLLLTTLGGTITGQPEISFGITGTNNKFVVQTATGLITPYDREVYTPLTTEGEATLTFTVDVAAVGSADIKGRAYFKGMLVEVQ